MRRRVAQRCCPFAVTACQQFVREKRILGVKIKQIPFLILSRGDSGAETIRHNVSWLSDDQRRRIVPFWPILLFDVWVQKSDESALKQAESLGITTQYDKLAPNYLESVALQPLSCGCPFDVKSFGIST
jgi:hypothetical protein